MKKYGRIETLLQDQNPTLHTQLYYRSLQTLKLGLLLEEHEVRERQRQIEQVQNRLISVRADQLRSSSEESEESQWKGPNLTSKLENAFHCGCGRSFAGEGDLKLHGLLAHPQSHQNWPQRVFKLQSLSE